MFHSEGGVEEVRSIKVLIQITLRQFGTARKTIYPEPKMFLGDRGTRLKGIIHFSRNGAKLSTEGNGKF